jgi:hypothetical protein
LRERRELVRNGSAARVFGGLRNLRAGTIELTDEAIVFAGPRDNRSWPRSRDPQRRKYLSREKLLIRSREKFHSSPRAPRPRNHRARPKASRWWQPSRIPRHRKADSTDNHSSPLEPYRPDHKAHPKASHSWPPSRDPRHRKARPTDNHRRGRIAEQVSDGIFLELLERVHFIFLPQRHRGTEAQGSDVRLSASYL